MSKEYESEDELEREAYELLRKHYRRQTVWYLRFLEWLKAIKHCIGWALREFCQCYRERND